MRLEAHRHRRGVGLTPLIDVVFLLLVFFLLASTFAKEEMMTIRLAGPSGRRQRWLAATLRHHQ